jgi:hypothetical protein
MGGATKTRHGLLGRSGRARNPELAAGARGKRVSAVSELVRPDDFGAPIGPHDAVQFWRFSGTVVFYECEDGHRLQHLTWENEKNRNFYQEGDLIFGAMVSKEWLQTANRNLFVQDEISTFWVVAQLLLGEEPPKYLSARRIERLQYEGHGEGRIETVWVVVLDGVQVEVTGDRQVMGFVRLNDEFGAARIWNRSARFMELIEKVMAPVVMLSLDLIAGEVFEPVKGIAAAVRWKALRKGGELVLKSGFRNISDRIIRSLILGIAVGTAAFIKAFAQSVLKQVVHNKTTPQRVGPLRLPELNWQEAVAAGASAFAASLIAGAIEKPILRNLEKQFEELPSLKNWKETLTKLIVYEVAMVFTTAPLALLRKATEDAYGKAWRDGKFEERRFSDEFMSTLSKELLPVLRETLMKLPEKLAEKFKAAESTAAAAAAGRGH